MQRCLLAYFCELRELNLPYLSRPKAANQDDSEGSPPSTAKGGLPSAHAGSWKEAAEPGPGYLLALWGSGTFHSHHGKGVPMHLPWTRVPGSGSKQQHIPHQGRWLRSHRRHARWGSIHSPEHTRKTSTRDNGQWRQRDEPTPDKRKAQRNLKGDSRWHLQCKEVTVHVFTS